MPSNYLERLFQMTMQDFGVQDQLHALLNQGINKNFGMREIIKTLINFFDIGEIMDELRTSYGDAYQRYLLESKGGAK